MLLETKRQRVKNIGISVIPEAGKYHNTPAAAFSNKDCG
jgi:hypothetical protein